MKPIFYYLLFIFISLSTITVAQTRFTVSGLVSDENGQPVKSATVFINGSEKITATNSAGHFVFADMTAGNFQLSVKMLGYSPYNQDIVVKTNSVDVKIALTVKPIALKTVLIGHDKNWADHFNIFKTQFLGTSPNAQNCVIVNPQVINFSTNQNMLTADADDFLIIENNQLGYKISYQLKTFEFNTATKLTNYDGNASFEVMHGSAAKETQWAKNRLLAYKGSLLHFLRSVFTNTALEEGFSTHQLYKPRHGIQYLMDPRPVKFDTVVTVVDSNFISLKFNGFKVDYNGNPKSIANGEKNATDTNPDKTVVQPMIYPTYGSGNSIIKLYTPNVLIDKKGSYAVYRTFLVSGDWAMRRIGDQLPFEYQP